MKLEADARIAFPRDVVFAAYRDRLPDLVPYLPNIKSITVDARTEEEDRVNLVNTWQANADIPKVLQSIVKPESLAWVDRATWKAPTSDCDWTIEPRIFTKNVKCSGNTSCKEDGDQTLMLIRGDLELDPHGIPGVPKLLAGTIVPAIEKFIVNLIRPNLISVAEGLEQFLKAESGREG